MKYSRFEWLVLTVGSAAIIGTMLVSMRGRPVIEEVVAQLILLSVLVGAVHWGRRGGFLAAVIGMVVYIAMRSPLLFSEGITYELLYLILIRMTVYGVVGIVGGEVCGRIKYVFARLEGGTDLDPETHLYNQTYIGRSIASNLSGHSRYKTPFSVVLLTLSPALTDDLRAPRRRSLLRSVANHVRNDVRLVDDVGRLADGEFIIVLPHTPKGGGAVAAERLRSGVRVLLSAHEDEVLARVLGAPEDMTELESLHAALGGAIEAAA